MAQTEKMTERFVDESSFLAGRGDAIRVVPPHTVDELATPAHDAPPAPAPHLTYRGGPLLQAVQVFTVFWGEQWNQQPLSDLAGKVNGFFDFILNSELIDQLAEYDVPGQSITRGQHIGTTVLTSPLGHVISDGSIRHHLRHEIATNNAFPKPTADTLYFIYLPPGVAVTQGGGRSCRVFCGYHEEVNGVYYAVMPFPGCAGCTGTLDQFDALTSTSSHELCEAITDAVPGTGWYDDANGEIGDICAWKTKEVGSYTVQVEWSNQHKGCV